MHRLYRLEGLQLRMRVRRRKHRCLHRGVVPKATHPHQRLSMDFVHDQLFDARPFRILTVIDALLHNSGRVTDRSLVLFECYRIRTDSGMPRLDIRFSTSHLMMASTR